MSRTCQAHHEVESESITIVFVIISIYFYFHYYYLPDGLDTWALAALWYTVEKLGLPLGSNTAELFYEGHVLPPCATDRADQSTVPWLKGQCETVIVEYAEVDAC